jgi:hypothetical protein
MFGDFELATLRGLRFRVGFEWMRNRITYARARAVCVCCV